MQLFAASLLGKSQANGAQIIALAASDHFYRHQLQIELSATPDAGTLTVAVKTPGSGAFIDLSPVIDLTGGNQLYVFDRFVSHIRLTPASLDSDKTYSVYHVAGRS